MQSEIQYSIFVETGYPTRILRNRLSILRGRVPPVYVPKESEPTIEYIGSNIWDRISDRLNPVSRALKYT